jgi:NAD(P)H-hydrate epimerase
MFLSRDQVRALDRRAAQELGMPGLVLMENAGRGAAEVLRSLAIDGRVLVCCGKGNNGGDGFVLARHLDNNHLPVSVIVFASQADLSGDALVNYRILTRTGVPIIHEERMPDRATLLPSLATASWIVDGLFGTGLTGAPREPFAEVVEAINASHTRVLALDIPSGLDCDRGVPLGPTIRADHTATFVAQKKGFAQPAAQDWLGQVHVIDIGVPRRLIEDVAARG